MLLSNAQTGHDCRSEDLFKDTLEKNTISTHGQGHAGITVFVRTLHWLVWVYLRTIKPKPKPTFDLRNQKAIFLLV